MGGLDVLPYLREGKHDSFAVDDKTFARCETRRLLENRPVLKLPVERR
jgi:hypothetical protein